MQAEFIETFKSKPPMFGIEKLVIYIDDEIDNNLIEFLMNIKTHKFEILEI